MGRVIPKRTLEDIRFRNDIADVVGSYFNLQRAGSALKALCPFHKEKTPSFHVNTHRQIFHCFGCGEGGDVFRFIMLIEGVDFVTAANMLAQRAGMELELEEGEGHDAGEKQALYKIHDDVAQFYRRCLLQMKSARAARHYLEERGLDERAGEAFLIGYAPDRWDAVLAWGRKHKVPARRLHAAGLVLERSGTGSSSGFYDRFRNRLMFPIRDEQNRVIGFSGRSLAEQDKTAKYINSPETPLFKKSRVLYALEKARRPMVDAREALICEGQIDVIRCHTAGFDTAVAPQGTAVTEEHARILRRYADSVCIVFDTDTAGQNAAMKTAEMFLDVGLAVRLASLPKGEDPDSFISRNGPDAFRQRIEQAQSAVGFQVNVLAGRDDLKSEVGMMRTAKAVLRTINHSPNAVQKAKLLQEAAERLHLPLKALEEDLQHMARREAARQSRARGSEKEATPEAAGPKPPEEVALCEHMVHADTDPEVVTLVEKYLRLDMISDADCRALVGAALEAAQGGRSFQDVLREQENTTDTIENFAAGVQMAPSKVTGQEYSRAEAVASLILGIWRRRLKREREALGPDQAERRSQITYDLSRLRTWAGGAPIIETELAMAD